MSNPEDNQEPPEEKLVTKQEVFVESYLETWNATEAARRAGYAHPNKQGPRLLVNVGIAERIKQRLDEKTMGANEVLARLTEHARLSMGDYIQVDDDGAVRLDMKKARDANKLGMIKKLKPTKFGTELELYDAQAALVHLGKHHKLFTEKHEHSFSLAEVLAGLPPGFGDAVRAALAAALSEE